MPTGPRGTSPVSPRDLTGSRARVLLKEKADREKSAEIDVAAIKRDAFRAGFDAAWEPAYLAGWNALAETMANAGIDVDAVLDLDDEHQDDESAGDE